MFAADVDGDGKLDILSASAGDDKIAWYRSDGATPPAFAEVVITEDPDGPGGAVGFADGASSVFAADLDGDGDVDVLSAAAFNHRIAWYENSAGDGTAWLPSVITSAAFDAVAVSAADLDGDGDLDVLSASKDDDRVAWYENTAGDGSAWTVRSISTDASKAFSVAAADVDGDGDVDVVSASRGDSKIAWYPNRGGGFRLGTLDVAPVVVLEGEEEALLDVLVTHNGRGADGELELATLELLFEEGPGDALTSAEANALIENLRVYRDGGSGEFGSGGHTSVVTLASLSLVAGVETVVLGDGDPLLAVAHGAPERFYVVVEVASGAASQSPKTFRVTHRTEASSSADDRAHDIPLELEFVEDAASRITLAASPSSDADGDGLLDVYETDSGSYASPTDTGTSPLDADTDDDGLLDGVETNTRVFVSAADTGSDPFDPDTDGDGVGDGEEVAAGTDPNHPPRALSPLGGAARTLLVAALLIAALQVGRGPVEP
ncbi:MAG: VCBS repeat-containing protein [Myxococcota bacterium]